MTIKEFMADRVVDFIKKYGPHVIEVAKNHSKSPNQFIKQIILKHMEYGTIVVLWDKNQIIGVGSFNIKNFDTAHIVECIVHPDYRFQNILKKMVEIGFKHFPYVKKLSFERRLKPNSKYREIDLSRFLKTSAVK